MGSNTIISMHEMHDDEIYYCMQSICKKYLKNIQRQSFFFHFQQSELRLLFVTRVPTTTSI